MTKSDYSRFAVLMVALGETFNRTVSGRLADIYFTSLREFTIDQVELAVSDAITTQRFFPTPADLRFVLVAPIEEEAAFQWAQVWMRLTGEPDVMNDRADEAIDLMGGWERKIDWLSMTDTPEYEVRAARKEFMQLYQSGERSEKRQHALPPGGFLKMLQAASERPLAP